jgi:hypothetical protein
VLTAFAQSSAEPDEGGLAFEAEEPHGR